MAHGGWGGIRTHETVARLPVFKTGAFNHSATPPEIPASRVRTLRSSSKRGHVASRGHTIVHERMNRKSGQIGKSVARGHADAMWRGEWILLISSRPCRDV